MCYEDGKPIIAMVASILISHHSSTAFTVWLFVSPNTIQFVWIRKNKQLHWGDVCWNYSPPSKWYFDHAKTSISPYKTNIIFAGSKLSILWRSHSKLAVNIHSISTRRCFRLINVSLMLLNCWCSFCYLLTIYGQQVESRTLHSASRLHSMGFCSPRWCCCYFSNGGCYS